MKRGAPHSTATDEPQHGGRRQPQTSCDSCRKRKLKCDRAEPCSNCVARGLPCQGQPSVKRPAPDAAQSLGTVATDAILSRLRALEEALLVKNSTASPGSSTAALSATPPDGQYSQTAKLLDETHLYDGPGLHVPCPLGTLKMAIAPDNSTPPAGLGVVWMMPREQAEALLQDFLDRILPLFPIIHGPTTRALVFDVYRCLSLGENIEPRFAALILGIGAITAWFWQPDAGQHSRFASTEEAAHACMVWRKWAFDILMQSRVASGGTSTLEEVQAWVMLASTVHNVDGGCSSRFRFLHDCTIAIARETSVHMVDSPRSDAKDDRVSREIKRRLWWHIAATDWLLSSMGGPAEGTYSIQPRHMNVKYPRNLNDNDVATWDESTTAPLNVPTQMSFTLQRIRIAEITRAIVDARPAGSPDTPVTDYDAVLALDRLFEQALQDLPPTFQLPPDFLHTYHHQQHHTDTQSPPPPPLPPPPLPVAVPIDLPDTISLQRVAIQLGFLSRRARLHRPSLLQQLQGTSAVPRNDPRAARSRDVCLASARTAVALSVSVIEASLMRGGSNGGGGGGRGKGAALSVHRVGIVINHLFMSCTLLAFYAGHAQHEQEREEGGQGKQDGNSITPNGGRMGTSPANPAGTAATTAVTTTTTTRATTPSSATPEATTTPQAVHAELARACSVLTRLGAESAATAELLRNLVGLLRRYRVPGVEAEPETETEAAGNGGTVDADGDVDVAEETRRGRDGGVGEAERRKTKRTKTNGAPLVPGGPHVQGAYAAWEGAAAGPGTGAGFASSLGGVGRVDGGNVMADESLQMMGGGVHVGTESGGDGLVDLDGLWDDFMMGAGEDYTQLFADLDYHCGAA